MRRLYWHSELWGQESWRQTVQDFWGWIRVEIYRANSKGLWNVIKYKVLIEKHFPWGRRESSSALETESFLIMKQAIWWWNEPNNGSLIRNSANIWRHNAIKVDTDLTHEHLRNKQQNQFGYKIGHLSSWIGSMENFNLASGALNISIIIFCQILWATVNGFYWDTMENF